MSEDIYAKPDLNKKVRFQKSENEDKNEEVGDSMDNTVIYDNCWIQGSTPPNKEDNNTEKPEQIISADVNSRKKNLVRAAAVFQLLLCLLLLAVVIVLVVLLIEGKSLNNNLITERDKLQTSYTEMKTLNTNLTMERDKIKILSANLTTERDKLQIRYSEIKTLSTNLTMERDKMKTLNTNLTMERDKMKTLNTNLTMERDKMKTLNTNLTTERDKLQTSYSEMRSLNTNLTQKTSQLEKERDSLMANNTNLTKQRDELQMKLETCPTKWNKFGNRCYFLSPSMGDWSNSKKSCENLDAQLVIISSEEEQKFITSLGVEAWIGLTDQNTHPVWKWVDGTVVNTTYWKKDQPDNYMNNEHCAEISTGGYSSNWNDLPCTDNVKFICEKVLT
ncbi:C-type lectin domain family 4 member M-like isoform X1 [Anabas testudineus]|uniref:C-type lectin domain family 4 member M-like isoform X1 n=1 Tax=Anabas testudineus TaxID=64144 RepID=UPI00143D5A29|nr:C-type lectin domain family 4 member M-like isoform X1 [Anabas testudineus]